MEKHTERTLILVKPDGVQRGLVGSIILRLESRGLKILGLKMLRLNSEMAEEHYGVHKDRPFFPNLVDFITSGPIVAVVLEGAHMCMQMRGVEKQNSYATTSSMMGLFRKDSRTREEFLNIISMKK